MTTLIEHRAQKVIEAWEALSEKDQTRIYQQYPQLALQIMGLSAHIEAFGRES